jgi:hypothetical protein
MTSAEKLTKLLIAIDTEGVCEQGVEENIWIEER